MESENEETYNTLTICPHHSDQEEDKILDEDPHNQEQTNVDANTPSSTFKTTHNEETLNSSGTIIDNSPEKSTQDTSKTEKSPKTAKKPKTFEFLKKRSDNSESRTKQRANKKSAQKSGSSQRSGVSSAVASSSSSSLPTHIMDDDLEDYEEGFGYTNLETNYTPPELPKKQNSADQPDDKTKSKTFKRTVTGTCKNSSMGIPESMVGLVIGKGGDRLRDFMEESNCQINISVRSLGPDVDRPVTLVGTGTEIDQARNKIENFIELQLAKDPGYIERKKREAEEMDRLLDDKFDEKSDVENSPEMSPRPDEKLLPPRTQRLADLDHRRESTVEQLIYDDDDDDVKIIETGVVGGGNNWEELEAIPMDENNKFDKKSITKITDYLSIPSARCTKVVGSNGMMIKYLREKFDVEINLNLNRGGKAEPKPCKFFGEQSKVKAALEAVANLVGISPDKNSSRPNSPMVKTSANREANRSKTTRKASSDSEATYSADGFRYATLPRPRPGSNGTEVFVCRQSVDMIVGSNGTVIDQIMEDTNTKIKWTYDDKKLDYRSCVISGNLSGIKEALQKIQDIDKTVQRTMPRKKKDKNSRERERGGGRDSREPGGRDRVDSGKEYKEGDYEEEGEKQWEIAVPISKLSNIIGKKAEHLKDVTRKTGVRIEIHDDKGGRYERFMTLTGSSNIQIEKAKRYLLEKAKMKPEDIFVAKRINLGGKGGQLNRVKSDSGEKHRRERELDSRSRRSNSRERSTRTSREDRSLTKDERSRRDRNLSNPSSTGRNSNGRNTPTSEMMNARGGGPGLLQPPPLLPFGAALPGVVGGGVLPPVPFPGMSFGFPPPDHPHGFPLPPPGMPPSSLPMMQGHAGPPPVGPGGHPHQPPTTVTPMRSVKKIQKAFKV